MPSGFGGSRQTALPASPASRQRLGGDGEGVCRIDARGNSGRADEERAALQFSCCSGVWVRPRWKQAGGSHANQSRLFLAVRFARPTLEGVPLASLSCTACGVVGCRVHEECMPWFGGSFVSGRLRSAQRAPGACSSAESARFPTLFCRAGAAAYPSPAFYVTNPLIQGTNRCPPRPAAIRAF
jgi:hypothetical protein